MADGSARFVKETISSWPPVTHANWPALPGRATPGVWQALSTRDGGEAVDADGL